MGSGSRVDGFVGEGPAIPTRTRKTIQFIKEIVGDHSDSEIYAALKEAGMDPNEAAQKLLNEDPFHEVQRKRDKKRENASYNASNEMAYHSEITRKWTKPQMPFARNSRQGGYTQNIPDAGIGCEFRVVRDNRVNQNSEHAFMTNTQSRGEHPTLSIMQKRNPKILTHVSTRCPVSDLGHGNSSDSTGAQNQQMGTQNSNKHSASLSGSSTGVYSSSSDPVHVPSTDSRTVGTVGAIRREIGAAGVCHPASEPSTSQSLAPNNSFSVLPAVKETSTPESAVQFMSLSTSEVIQSDQNLESEAIVSGTEAGRSFSANQYNAKMHPQPVGHQKATQYNMEWKPKVSQKPSISTSRVVTESATQTSAQADISTVMDAEVTSLSDKLSQVGIYENEHVIIPQHLRIPESERPHLTFGSFEVGLDSPKDFMSAIQEFGDLKSSVNEQSISTSTSDSVFCKQDVSSANKAEATDGFARTSQSDSPASVLDSKETSYVNTDSLRVPNAENYPEIGLLQSKSPHGHQEQHQLQNTSSLPSYSETYDTQNKFEEPFYRTEMEDNVRGQGLASPREDLSSHFANVSVPSTITSVQHQQPSAQQMAQLNPHVQFPHFANYLPYRQLVPPMYVPPIAVPNYSSNPAFPHPSNGSGYVLMPGGSSQLSASGVKYAASQYKSVPTSTPIGYGNYTNQSGYPIPISSSATGTVATSLDDVTRMKYKDNGLFLPNAQAETPELWVPSPRGLPNVQSAPYFNIPGQVHHAAFMPAHGGHASFNASPQTSHAMHGLYQTPQPTAIANTNHLVHQQVPPGMSGNVRVGVAAAAPQIGTYQQPQLGHPSWTGNF